MQQKKVMVAASPVSTDNQGREMLGNTLVNWTWSPQMLIAIRLENYDCCMQRPWLGLVSGN
jgi:hypothetical protein